MLLSAYIQSAENKRVIRDFARKHLTQQWPKQTKAVENAIDVALDDSVTEGLQPYASWANTKENAASVNISVYKVLKIRVENCMRGAQVDHEQELTEMFRGPAQRDSVRFHEVSDGNGGPQERELETLRDRHAQAWK
jgi:hypothetical protein